MCQKKVIHYTGWMNSDKVVPASLLVHLNIGQVLSNSGMLLSGDEMAELTKPYRNRFQSIWILCGIDAVGTWPERKVLRAIRDPFD